MNMADTRKVDRIADASGKIRNELLRILSMPIHPHEKVDPIEAVADYLLDNGVTIEKYSEWVLVPVGPVANYRCGNIDCCRLIPFGCMPEELSYCPYCGSKMKA
jgi:hypothetical protein